jgi:hypothetical protein
MQTDGVQIRTDEGSVTCLPRLEPPSFPPLFALTRGLEERYYSDGNSPSTLTNPPIGPMSVGFFMQRPLPHHLLSAGKVTDCAGLAVLTDHQQAQGKHEKECRGVH